MRNHELADPTPDLDVHAALLEVSQGALSRLEDRHGILLGRLEKYVRAPGGDLELVARFPDSDVRITQFDDKPVRTTEKPGRDD